MHPSVEFAQKPPAGARGKLADVGVIWDTKLLPRPAQRSFGAQSLGYGLCRCQAGKQTDEGQGTSHRTVRFLEELKQLQRCTAAAHHTWRNPPKIAWSSFSLMLTVHAAAGSCKSLWIVDANICFVFIPQENVQVKVIYLSSWRWFLTGKTQASRLEQLCSV